jgi:hypothetical protein
LNSFTLAALFKANSFTSNSYIDSPIIDSTYTSGSYYGTGMGVSATTISIVYNNGYLTHSYNFDTSKWYYLVVVYDYEKGKISSYVNSTLISTSMVTISSSSYYRNFYVGMDGYAGSYFYGYIDEVRIYNRTLNPIEIQKIQNIVDKDKTRGLELNIQFENSTSDLSGNGYTTTPTSLTYSSGAFGLGGTFNGASSKVTTNLQAKYSLYTLSMFFKCSSFASNSYLGSPLISADTSSTANGPSVGVTSSAIRYSYPSSSYSYISYTFSTSNWYHLVLLVDEYNGVITAYINGSKVSSTGSASYSSSATYSSFNIGYDAKNSIYFSGTIDSVRIYSRLLNDQEITLIRTEAVDGVETPPSTPIGEDLQVYYPFNDNIYDYSGNGRDGTISGSLTYTSSVKSSYANCAYFSSSAAVSTSYSSSNLYNYTLSIFFKANSFSSNSYVDSPLIDSDYSSYHGIGMGVSSSGVSICYPGGYVTHDKSFVTSTWYHVAVVFDRTNGIVTSYVNGVKLSTSAVTFSSLSYTGTFYVGKDNAHTYYFSGYLDEAKIYTRALTDSEIATLYFDNVTISSSSTTNIIPEVPLDWDMILTYGAFGLGAIITIIIVVKLKR